MQTTPFRLILIGLMGLGSSPSQSEQLVLPPLVVTPSRQSESLEDVQATTILIDRQTIEQSQALDVSQLLRFHAGIEISRAGGPGQQTSVFLRGTDSNQTLILLDGVSLNPGTIGNASIQHINPQSIERIEIVKGPGSSLYGSSAMGGVINIISRQDSLPTGMAATASLTLGGNNTRDVALGASYRGDQLYLGLDANQLKTDGFPTRQESDIDRGHKNTSLNLSVGADGETIDIELRHWQAKGNTEYLDYFLTPVDQDFTNQVTSMTGKAALTAHWESRLSFSQMLDEIEQNQSDDFIQTRRNTLDWQNNLQVDRHRLTAGLTLSHEDTESFSFGIGYDETIATVELFAADDISIGDHRLTLATRYTDHELFESAWTWNLAWGYQLTPDTRLVASIGSAFRAPDSTDLFGYGGNTELDPERSRSIELSLRQQLPASQQLSASLFQTRIKDLIVFYDPDGFLGPIHGENTNLEEARINGLELNYQLRQGFWDLTIEALLQNPENLANDRTLARRARQNLTLKLAYSNPHWDSRLEILAAGKRYDSDFSDMRMGGYGLANLSGRLYLDQAWTLEGRIENLFDKEYELASGYNTQDQSIFVGMKYQ